MMDSSKYRVGYFPVDKKYNKWVEKDHVDKAPIWCSVDLRDGNQSLVIPMSLEENSSITICCLKSVLRKSRLVSCGK